MLCDHAEYANEALASVVLGGICAAIDRAYERGGGKAISAADRARRAAKQRVRDAACLVDGRPTMAGWANHGDGEYSHISNPSIRVKRICRNVKALSSKGLLTTTDLWGWRLAGQSQDWRGLFPTRAVAFDAATGALAEMAAADV